MDGEAFNVVDDDLPNSRQFLKAYKKHGKSFRSINVPYWLFYGFSWAWGKVFRLVRRSTSPGVQSEPLCDVLERESVQQSKA